MKILTSLPIIKNSRGFEFQVTCPYYNCEKGILFNRHLINEVIQCPSCKQDVLLNFSTLQEPGIEHIKQLKVMTMSLWVKTDKSPGTWKACVEQILQNHRVWLSKASTYEIYRPEKE